MAILERNLHINISMGDIPADRQPSRDIWRDCPYLALTYNPGRGFHYMDDFRTSPTTLAAGQSAAVIANTGGRYQGLTAVNATIASLEDAIGIVRMNVTTTEHTHAILSAFGGTDNTPLSIDSNKPYWFEGRYRTNAVTTAQRGIFIGLGEKGLLHATNLMANTTMALSDSEKTIGFNALQADTTVLRAQSSEDDEYNEVGQSTIAADTWFKVGLKFDGSNLRFYFNGQQVGRAIASTDDAYPADETLALYMAIKRRDAGDNNRLDCDWIRAAQTD